MKPPKRPPDYIFDDYLKFWFDEMVSSREHKLIVKNGKLCYFLYNFDNTKKYHFKYNEEIQQAYKKWISKHFLKEDK